MNEIINDQFENFQEELNRRSKKLKIKPNFTKDKLDDIMDLIECMKSKQIIENETNR